MMALSAVLAWCRFRFVRFACDERAGTTLALTPAILWMRRGTRLHRQLGYVWVSALALTAIDSFAIRTSGHLSLIHILSVVIGLGPTFAYAAYLTMATREGGQAIRIDSPRFTLKHPAVREREVSFSIQARTARRAASPPHAPVSRPAR